jgi:hypothetical protein
MVCLMQILPLLCKQTQDETSALLLLADAAAAAAGPSSMGPASSSSAQHAREEFQRPQLVLELEDASELPAAMAVLALLYGVRKLLSGLSEEQQLQAALLAANWKLPHISTAVVGAFDDDMPTSLQPLLKQVLLAVFGNLEQSLADSDLRNMLFQLSLPNMELLLSSDELQVGAQHDGTATPQKFH